MDVIKKKPLENPVLKANFVSKVIIFWVWPFFRKGYKKDLTIDDIPDVPPDMKAENNGKSLEKNWERCRRTQKRVTPESEPFLDVEMTTISSPTKVHQTTTKVNESNEFSMLFRALFHTFGLEYLAIWPLMIILDCFIRVAQPYFLLLLIRSFLQKSPDVSAQYMFAAGVCLTTFIITLVNNPCLLYIQKLGMRTRIALSSLLQRKMTRLSQTCATNAGELSTLLANDAGRIEQYLLFIPYLLIGPIQLAIFMYFLCDEFGISSLAGIGFIIASLPLQYWNGSKSAEYRQKIGKQTEDRTRVLDETVTGMNAIKMYAWENYLKKTINDFRKLEVKMLKKRSSLHAFYMSMFLTSSRLVPFLTFLTFVLMSGSLTADRVFFAIAVYNTATHFLGFFLLSAVRGIGEIIGSLRRMQAFLVRPEISRSQAGYTHSSSVITVPKISLNEACARWSNDKLILEDIHVDLGADELVIIVGPVGSGKSSMLQLILAELPLLSGQCSIDGRISYCSQTPWIFDGTIRQNILFTETFNETKYKRVLRAAGLEQDLKQFGGAGDMTLVGDKGKSLSGGQKARVNLARAMYRDADIFLLDDPLSAVDTAVSQNLFREFSEGYLHGKLRILVTHQHRYLSQAHHVIFMKDGKIRARGNYDEICTNEEFQDFVGTLSDTDVDSLYTGVALNTKNTDENKSEPEVSGEEQATGSIGFKTYWRYFNSADAKCQLLFHIIIFLVSQMFATVIEVWLALWTNAEERQLEEKMEKSVFKSILESNENYTLTRMNEILEDSNFTMKSEAFQQESSNIIDQLEHLDQHIYLCVYAGLTGAVFLTNLAKAIGFFGYCMKICNNLHKRMLNSLMRATPAFFNDNTSGRIMNRFTKDIGIVDEAIPFSFFDMFTIFLQIGTVILLIIIGEWYTLVPIVPFVIILWYVRRYYVTTSRDLKRIDGTTKSPVFSHLTAAHAGIITIRAFEAEKSISTQFDDQQDIHTASTFMFAATQRCFDIWVETLATVLLTAVVFTFLLAQNFGNVNFADHGGNVALAICSAMSLTNWLQYGMRTSADVENCMISVERALEYTKLTSEAPLQGKTVDENWPSQGKIRFEDVSMSYKNPGVDNVLNNLSFDIDPKEKVGIVGRTGAGKSSIFWAIFRMAEIHEGKMQIDQYFLKDDLGLHQLRKNISIIPQDPILFQNTLRYNLDPSGSLYEDIDMNNALKKVKLDKSLGDEISAGGTNYCVGERQLVALARAILQKKKVIAMDEATSNIDPRTDAIIQETLRKEFEDSTVLTIAHRLETVIDADKILVMENGSLREFDSPYILLRKPDGALLDLVNKTGEESARELKRKAKEAWQAKQNKS